MFMTIVEGDDEIRIIALIGGTKDYTKKLRDDNICSEVGCILYRMKT